MARYPKKTYSRAFPTTTQHRGKNLTISNVPVMLWKAASLKAKRTGISLRSIVLQAVADFVKGEETPNADL